MRRLHSQAIKLSKIQFWKQTIHQKDPECNLYLQRLWQIYRPCFRQLKTILQHRHPSKDLRWITKAFQLRTIKKQELPSSIHSIKAIPSFRKSKEEAQITQVQLICAINKSTKITWMKTIVSQLIFLLTLLFYIEKKLCREVSNTS